MEVNEFDSIIKTSKNILIVSHINPDGDTLGSMCAMYQAILNRYKKKCDMLILSKLPKIYDYLPNIHLAKHIDEFDKSREFDLVIAVDIAALDRLCDGKILFDKAKATINVDHHKTNSNYGSLAFVEPYASSTGEVIYKLFKKYDWDIDINIATCLYTAILTDTGSFRFENTSSDVLKIASELVAIGIKPCDLYKKCYESKNKEMVLFQAYCVQKAEFVDDDKIAYTIIYKRNMEDYKAGDDYTDGIAEQLRAINSTQVAFVVKEVDSKTCKISMRSKSVDIAEICALFNGGGHKFAAGCTIKASPKDAAKKLLAEIRKQNY